MLPNATGNPSHQLEISIRHISTIYSHPAAFGQCETFLSTHLKGVQQVEVSSTSAAAERVAQGGREGSSCAISSGLAAGLHGLQVLQEGIQDRGDNETRFFVLRKGDGQATVPPSPSASPRAHQKWKTLISFTLPRQPSGTLADTLLIFKNYGLNLTGINSRPSLEHSWHYVFLVEVQGRREGEDERVGGEGVMGEGGARGGEGVMNQALRELGGKTKGWRWLGSWVDRGAG